MSPPPNFGYLKPCVVSCTVHVWMTKDHSKQEFLSTWSKPSWLKTVEFPFPWKKIEEWKKKSFSQFMCFLSIFIFMGYTYTFSLAHTHSPSLWRGSLRAVGFKIKLWKNIPFGITLTVSHVFLKYFTYVIFFSGHRDTQHPLSLGIAVTALQFWVVSNGKSFSIFLGPLKSPRFSFKAEDIFFHHLLARMLWNPALGEPGVPV